MLQALGLAAIPGSTAPLNPRIAMQSSSEACLGMEKILKEERLQSDLQSGSIKVEIVRNDASDRSLILLTGTKNLFQRQLPKMPKEYITRLVYCRKHVTLAVIPSDNIFRVLAAITYRSFPDRKFVEIAFCAVSSSEQIKGFGSFLMNQLKMHLIERENCSHLLTYADNYAIGYFQKQGFTTDVLGSGVEKEIWSGCIKDYDGGTLMICTLLPQVNYLKVFSMLDQQREFVMQRIRATSHCFTARPGIGRLLENGRLPAYSEIPGLVEAGWTKEMEEAVGQQPKKSKMYEVIRSLVSSLQNHPNAWPFLRPVNKTEVPDYYTIIERPMDLSTIEKNLEENLYRNMERFISDVTLIFTNCRTFNKPNTQYHKCVERLEEHFRKKLGALQESNPELFEKISVLAEQPFAP